MPMSFTRRASDARIAPVSRSTLTLVVFPLLLLLLLLSVRVEDNGNGNASPSPSPPHVVSNEDDRDNRVRDTGSVRNPSATLSLHFHRLMYDSGVVVIIVFRNRNRGGRVGDRLMSPIPYQFFFFTMTTSAKVKTTRATLSSTYMILQGIPLFSVSCAPEGLKCIMMIYNTPCCARMDTWRRRTTAHTKASLVSKNLQMMAFAARSSSMFHRLAMSSSESLSKNSPPPLRCRISVT